MGSVENGKLEDQWLGIAVAATGMQWYDEDAQDFRQDIEIPHGLNLNPCRIGAPLRILYFP